MRTLRFLPPLALVAVPLILPFLAILFGLGALSM
jgi:hypothetical protein